MKTIEECKENIESFANELSTEHELKCIFEGEVGFGRECVGIVSAESENYIAFNPLNRNDYNYIPEYFDPRLQEIAPEDAYHKYDCICVLGRDEDSIRQLDKWCDALRELEVELVCYKNGDSGIQAMITGAYTFTVVPKNKLPYVPEE